MVKVHRQEQVLYPEVVLKDADISDSVKEAVVRLTGVMVVYGDGWEEPTTGSIKHRDVQVTIDGSTITGEQFDKCWDVVVTSGAKSYRVTLDQYIVNQYNDFYFEGDYE
jgi:hypothetical protein